VGPRKFLNCTDIYEDYKNIEQLMLEQMTGMPFEEMVGKIMANQKIK
jgi:hypothetical protein